jgi:hypothetical protein
MHHSRLYSFKSEGVSTCNSSAVQTQENSFCDIKLPAKWFQSIESFFEFCSKILLSPFRRVVPRASCCILCSSNHVRLIRGGGWHAVATEEESMCAYFAAPLRSHAIHLHLRDRNPLYDFYINFLISNMYSENTKGMESRLRQLYLI